MKPKLTQVLSRWIIHWSRYQAPEIAHFRIEGTLLSGKVIITSAITLLVRRSENSIVVKTASGNTYALLGPGHSQDYGKNPEELAPDLIDFIQTSLSMCPKCGKKTSEREKGPCASCLHSYLERNPHVN